MDMLLNFWIPMIHFRVFFLKFDSFSPSQPLALSVVTMGLFAPHKMAEIRLSLSNDGRLDPRISLQNKPQHTNHQQNCHRSGTNSRIWVGAGDQVRPHAVITPECVVGVVLLFDDQQTVVPGHGAPVLSFPVGEVLVRLVEVHPCTHSVQVVAVFLFEQVNEVVLVIVISPPHPAGQGAERRPQVGAHCRAGLGEGPHLTCRGGNMKIFSFFANVFCIYLDCSEFFQT